MESPFLERSHDEDVEVQESVKNFLNQLSIDWNVFYPVLKKAKIAEMPELVSFGLLPIQEIVEIIGT